MDIRVTTGMESVVKTQHSSNFKQSVNQISSETSLYEEAVIYQKSTNEEIYHTYDKKAIDKLKEEANQRFQNLRNMVEELLKRQGLTFNDIDDKKVVKIDQETRTEAQKAISIDGEFGVDKVATRIIDFAKAISGNDKGKISKLKAAIEEGFEEAKKAFGGELPEISNQTYEEVMKRLEDWSNE
jgi:hypothetical protein